MAGKLVANAEWKSIPIDISVFDKSGAVDLIGFEELHDYEIIREGDGKASKRKKKSKETKNKKQKLEKAGEFLEDGGTEEVVKEKKKKNKKKKKAPKDSETNKEQKSPEKIVGFQEDNEPELEFEEEQEENESEDEEKEFEMDEKTISRMAEWNKLFVPMPIMRALADQKFFKPTPIQALVLPAAIRGRRDIVGAAETGSGKTLAFGIPILSGILDDRKYEQDLEDAAALDAAYDAEKLQSEEAEETPKDEEIQSSEEDSGAPESSEGSTSKPQKKLRALILTPTRELAVQVKNHLVAVAKYTGIKVAVVIGGMAVPKQERVLRKGPDVVVATPGRLWELINEGNPHLSNLEDIRYLAIDETDRMLEKGHFRELQAILSLVNSDANKKARRQNFVFSATLAVVHELPERLKEKRKKPLTSDQKLNEIMEEIGVKAKAKVVDITNKSVTADTLTEMRIPCSIEEKDFYLYYILRQHPGRTLVFCNSIDCVRRLTSVLDVLKCRPMPLHAQMHQKQRLKNLERFSSDEKGLLIATDVAARGLDVPNVQHVIHYQVPRTSESYVHRSGRTARASREGISVVFVEPAEYAAYQKMCKTLGRTKDLPDFPVDSGIFPAIKQIVITARDYEKMLHMHKKKQSETNWFKKMASEADLILEDDERRHDSDELEDQADLSKDLKVKKLQLDGLLKQKLVPRGTSILYPASTSDNIKKIIESENGKNSLKTISEGRKRTKNKKDKVKNKKKNKKSMNKQ